VLSSSRVDSKRIVVVSLKNVKLEFQIDSKVEPVHANAPEAISSCELSNERVRVRMLAMVVMRGESPWYCNTDMFEMVTDESCLDVKMDRNPAEQLALRMEVFVREATEGSESERNG